MSSRITYIPFGNTNDHAIDYLLGILVDARAVTNKMVNNITTEELHWQYAEGWNTIGCLLAHIISCSHYLRIVFLQQRQLTQAEKDQFLPGLEMGKYIPQLINHQPLEKYQSQLAASSALLEEAIKNITQEEFFEKREGYNEETGCNLAWVFYHLAEDEVHHRGQISLLRKLYKTQHAI